MSLQALPNFLIIGAAKCGTTSLHFYLSQHPAIWMSTPKELNFFILEKNWERGLDWYRSHFDDRFALRGEASPYYSAEPRHPGVARRIWSVIPDARLIFLARDPVERTISAYAHARVYDKEDQPFEEAVLGSDRNHYIDESSYFRQISRYLECFPRHQILMLSAEDLLRQRGRVLQEVAAFLGIGQFNVSWRHHLRLNQSAYQRRLTPFGRRISPLPGEAVLGKHAPLLRTLYRKVALFPFSRRVARPVLPGDVRVELAARLRDDAARFRTVSGLPLSDWTVW